MLPPTPAMARAAPATAAGGTGRPRTITWCRTVRSATVGGRASTVGSTVTCMPVRSATSAATGPSRPASVPVRPAARTTTPSTSWPCTTTCSTSTTSTGSGPADCSAPNSVAVTPGRSAPVTVSSAPVDVVRGSIGAGTAASVTPSWCPTAAPAPATGPRERAPDATAPRRPMADGAPRVTCWSERSGEVLVVRTTALAAGQTDLAGVGLVALAGVGLHLQPVLQVRVVQLDRRALGADPRDLEEVVPRRRGGGRPLQRVAVAPGVIAQRQAPVLPGLHHVVEERQRGRPQHEGEDRRDHVQRGEPVAG